MDGVLTRDRLEGKGEETREYHCGGGERARGSGERKGGHD